MAFKIYFHLAYMNCMVLLPEKYVIYFTYGQVLAKHLLPDLLKIYWIHIFIAIYHHSSVLKKLEACFTC